jgi:hypothetical protein
MNIAEGSRRMRRAGQWSVILSVGASALSMGLAMPFNLLQPLHLFVLFLPIALVGTALWLAGWILEGFAKNAD